MTGATLHPSAIRDFRPAAVSPELTIPPLPAAEDPPLLLTPLRFVDQARLGRNAWWRYGLAVGLFLLLEIAAAVGLGVISVAAFGLIEGLPTPKAALDGFAASGVLMFGLMMAASALGAPILFLVVRLLHRRSWRSLVVGPLGFDWSGFFHSLGLALAIGCFGVFVEQIVWPGSARSAFEAERFWPFLALAIVLVPLQTLAEEAFFRGYALQGVARATRLFALRLAVPALIFAAAHLNNAAVVQGGLWGVLDYGVVAVYLTFLCLRGDGIEHAWGFHLGNNWLAFVLITWRGGDFGVPSLFVVDQVDFAGGLVVTLITCALHYALLLRFSPPRLVGRRAPAGGSAPGILASA